MAENKGADEGTKRQEVRRLQIVGHLLKRSCFPSQRSPSVKDQDGSSISLVYLSIYLPRFAHETYESSYFTFHCARFNNARRRLFLS